MKQPYLTTEQARSFYDHMGKRQDWQRFYEGRAIQMLLEHGDFAAARSVLELGCGTGLLAEILLNHYLDANTTYVATDISPVMVELARQRLMPFGKRATVIQTEGQFDSLPQLLPCDRFLSTYVLDLLPPKVITQALDHAYSSLTPGGLLCLISLTNGCTLLSRTIIYAWQKLHHINPKLVGGCRPIQLRDYLPKHLWQTTFDHTLSVAGIPSQIVIASKR